MCQTRTYGLYNIYNICLLNINLLFNSEYLRCLKMPCPVSSFVEQVQVSATFSFSLLFLLCSRCLGHLSGSFANSSDKSYWFYLYKPNQTWIIGSVRITTGFSCSFLSPMAMKDSLFRLVESKNSPVHIFKGAITLLARKSPKSRSLSQCYKVLRINSRRTEFDI